MIEYLALGLTWLVVTTAFAVLAGKCIAAGLDGGAGPHRRLPAKEQTPPVPVESLGEALAVPSQRRPSVPAEPVR